MFQAVRAAKRAEWRLSFEPKVNESRKTAKELSKKLAVAGQKGFRGGLKKVEIAVESALIFSPLPQFHYFRVGDGKTFAKAGISHILKHTTK